MTIRDRAIQRAYEKLLELEFWAIRSDAAAVVDAVLGEIEEPGERAVLDACDAHWMHFCAMGPRERENEIVRMKRAVSAAIKHIREGGE